MISDKISSYTVHFPGMNPEQQMHLDPCSLGTPGAATKSLFGNGHIALNMAKFIH